MVRVCHVRAWRGHQRIRHSIVHFPVCQDFRFMLRGLVRIIVRGQIKNRNLRFFLPTLQNLRPDRLFLPFRLGRFQVLCRVLESCHRAEHNCGR